MSNGLIAAEVFFFKQKTAYEMRISDWSSDVCSSDLLWLRTIDTILALMAIQIRTSLDEIDTGEAYVPHRPARPEKVEGGKRFAPVSDYEPAGDQPPAIREMVSTAQGGEQIGRAS